MVQLNLSAEPGGSKVTLDHAGFPEGAAEHLEAGWHTMYWEPLTAYCRDIV